jgi:polysaccharide export outer membrane protein
MEKNRVRFSCGILYLLGAVIMPAMMTIPARAQRTEGAAPSTPSLAGLASASGKAGAGVQSGGPTIIPKDFSALRIEPGDLLAVNVYDSPEFSNSYRIDPEGNLTLPLCGKVNLRGLTLTEAAKRLETALKDGQILKQPQVNLDVVQYSGQYVMVTGEVAFPGRVSLIAPTLLSEIITQAGGVTPLAGAKIRLRHADGAQPEEEIPYSRSKGTSESAAILVRPGDSIIIPRAGIIYVLGAVNRPGGYVMQEDGKLNVAEALALSGGTLLQAKTGSVRVIRRNPDGTVLDFPVSYQGLVKGTQTPLQLQAEDIVYVPMSKVKMTLSDATGIISSAATAAIVTHP